MTPPTIDEGPPVPLLVEGRIDPPTLVRLFADIRAAGTVFGVREKGLPAEYATPAGLSLEDALRRLQSGESRAVQIQYGYADSEWTDTILALAEEYRVIRCKHDPRSVVS